MPSIKEVLLFVVGVLIIPAFVSALVALSIRREKISTQPKKP